MATWWPAVYVDGTPEEWWLVSEDGHLIRTAPCVPGTVPLSREVTDPDATRRLPRC